MTLKTLKCSSEFINHKLPQRGRGRSPGRQHIFGLFEAHRTLLVERTASPTSQQSQSVFFCVKPSTQSTIGEHGPLAALWLCPWQLMHPSDVSLTLSVCLCMCRYCLPLVVTLARQVYIWSVLVYNSTQSQSTYHQLCQINVNFL